ncbi:MAG: transcriptional regulator, TetR family [Bacteroidetes bacterium]|nr:transcriptional regulator, TetR family [Bacteroidota bacterium]
MGITERKEREKLEMRELILEAATSMFLEEGYEKTSIRNIAEKIEYSPATIYLYFKDKDELFFAIHELGFQKLLLEMVPLAQIEDPFQRLRQMARIYIEFGLNNPEYYDLMFIMRAPMNSIKEQVKAEQCWEGGESTFGFLTSIMEECIAKGLVKSDDAMMLSIYAWTCVHGMVSLNIRERLGMLEMDSDGIKALMMRTLDMIIDNIRK